MSETSDHYQDLKESLKSLENLHIDLDSTKFPHLHRYEAKLEERKYAIPDNTTELSIR